MYWMTHADHGTTTAYSTNEKGQLEAAGWKLLNEGESPIHPPKVKPVDLAQVEKDAMNAALSRLSAALGNPALEVPAGGYPAVALIDCAVDVLSQELAQLSAPQPDEPDLLESPVAQILPQLGSMTLEPLQALRARETEGKARKGLLAAIDDAISDIEAKA